MNSKKLGMIAAAALSLAAAQGFASETKAKGDMVCANSCGGKHGASGCAGHKVLSAKTEAECKKLADSKWMPKSEVKEEAKDKPAAK